MASLHDSELILNEDGSIYHLKLKPGELAEKIITVGDPDRVDKVARYFDKVLLERQAREFKTITGQLGNQTISVISTGIGTDNIDIVLNEIDALFNIDFDTRKIKENKTSLKFMRLGTSGSIQKDLVVDTLVISKVAIGLEGLMLYYDYQESNEEKRLSEAVNQILSNGKIATSTSCDKALMDIFKQNFLPVNTITATGFYAPQGRSLRIKPSIHDFITKMNKINTSGQKVHNLEMETAGIYGLSNLLGHQAISISAILANRIDRTFSQQASKSVDRMIKVALELWESC